MPRTSVLVGMMGGFLKLPADAETWRQSSAAQIGSKRTRRSNEVARMLWPDFEWLAQKRAPIKRFSFLPIKFQYNRVFEALWRKVVDSGTCCTDTYVLLMRLI